MIRIAMILCLVLGATQAASDEAAVNTSKCAMCHKDPDVFADKTQEELVKAIEASAESPRHKYTKGLNDEQVKALAEALLSGK